MTLKAHGAALNQFFQRALHLLEVNFAADALVDFANGGLWIALQVLPDDVQPIDAIDDLQLLDHHHQTTTVSSQSAWQNECAIGQGHLGASNLELGQSASNVAPLMPPGIAISLTDS